MPVALSGTVTRFATVSSAVKLRLETRRHRGPLGEDGQEAGSDVLVAVTLSTAADALVGTVPPVTCTFSEVAAARV